MSGIHSGVQIKIKEINSNALFIQSRNHWLNLASVHAVELSKIFFAYLEKIYSSFAASTDRWEVLLLKHVPVVLKRVIDTG